MRKRKILAWFFAILAMTVLLPIGASFWQVGGKTTSTDIGQIVEESSGKAVAYIGSTYYSTIERALSDAKTNSTDKSVYVIPGTTTTITSNCTIASGVSLYVPFTGTQWDISSNSDLNSLGDGFADSNAANVKSKRSSLIYIDNNISLTIASGGYLYLGGLFRTGGISSSYCEISLGRGSQIVDNGTFYCYGYVKENQDADSITSSKETMINVGSTGKLYSAMAVYDRKSGAGYTGLPNLGICPISVFDFPNLQTLVDIDYGGIFDAVIRFAMSINDYSHTVNKTLGVVRPYGDSTQSIFYLHSGASATIEYTPPNRLYTSTSISTKTYVTFSGQVTMGYIYVDASYKQGSISFEMIIDSSKYYLPFSYRFDIEFLNGSTFNQNYGVKILPGCVFTIDDGASFNVNADLIVYEQDALDEAIGYFVSYPDSSSVDEGKLINNGTLTVYSTASIGGKILTEKTDDSAILNLQNASSSNLYAKSSEGLIGSSTAIDIIYFAEGYYFDSTSSSLMSLCQFTAGATINSLDGGTGVWSNGGIEQYEFTFDVGTVDTESTYLFSYTFSVADDTNGTNKIDVVSGSTKATSLRVAKGKSVYAVVSRSISVQLYIDNVSSSLSSSGWYTSNGDHDFIITPSKAVGITTKITGTLSSSWSGSSGSGYTSFDIQESLDNGSTWTSVGTNSSGEATVYVVENSKFRIVVTNGYRGSYYSYIKYEYEGTYTIDGNSGGSISLSCLYDTSGTSSAYTASGEYYFSFEFGTTLGRIPCFAPGTMITMGDGSSKPIEEISMGDSIMSFNHETGQYESKKVLALCDHGEKEYDILNLKFSNGTSIEIIGYHAFFDKMTRSYEYISYLNYQDYIGHEFAVETGGSTQLVSIETYKKVTHSYAIASEGNMNSIANGLLNMTATPGMDRVWNYFEFDENMKWDEAAMNRDIATYGLYSYDEWSHLISQAVFDGFNFKYFKVAVGKGLVTEEGIVSFLELFAELIDDGEIIVSN